MPARTITRRSIKTVAQAKMPDGSVGALIRVDYYDETPRESGTKQHIGTDFFIGATATIPEGNAPDFQVAKAIMDNGERLTAKEIGMIK